MPLETTGEIFIKDFVLRQRAFPGAGAGEMQINKEENKRKILSRGTFRCFPARCRVLFCRVVSILTKGRPDNYVAVATAVTVPSSHHVPPQRHQEVTGYSLARRTTSRDEVASSVCRVSWIIRLHCSHNFATARALTRRNTSRRKRERERQNSLSVSRAGYRRERMRKRER